MLTVLAQCTSKKSLSLPLLFSSLVRNFPSSEYFRLLTHDWKTLLNLQVLCWNLLWVCLQGITSICWQGKASSRCSWLPWVPKAQKTSQNWGLNTEECSAPCLDPGLSSFVWALHISLSNSNCTLEQRPHADCASDYIRQLPDHSVCFSSEATA